VLAEKKEREGVYIQREEVVIITVILDFKREEVVIIHHYCDSYFNRAQASAVTQEKIKEDIKIIMLLKLY
jgi:hypothetical protein